MSDLDQLTQVIQVILSNDNQARIQGENLLLSLRQGDFNSYVITFANLLNVSTSKHIRMFCVVHLRRLLSNFVESTKSSQWHTLPNDTQKFLKTLFIEVLQKEEDGPTRRVLCDLIGELASTIKQLDTAKKSKMGEEGQQWDSLMQNIWGFLTSGNIVLMESALKILSILFLYCGKDFAQHKDDLYNILKQALEHDDLRVKASAIEAISSFMGSSFTKDCMAFKDLIPLVLTSTVSIISKNEDLGADVLNELSDILAAECRLFKPYFKEFFTMLKEITQMNLTIDTIRGNALEILVQLIEAIPSVPRNKTEFIKEFFECNYLYMVSCVEDADQQWISPPEGFVDTTDDSNSHEASVKHAMYMIDRVMGKLGSELALPIFSQVLLEVAKVENWKYKHSALMGLSQIGEYIGDAKELDYVVSFTLNFFKDEHPKVRFAALQCIGQFSEDSKPEFQMGYTEKIIPALVGMFSDSVPRVVAHALAAITNFLDGAERGSVSNYIQQVLEPCLGFINQSISFVKEAAVTAVATLAEACEHEFIPYWENTAQLLFQILKDAPDKRYKLLKGSAIECLMLIGQSVGKQEFRKGAHDIIEKLADIQKNYVEEVDPPKSYLLSAWQRICLILGEDFLPYLDHILPLLFNLVEEIVQTQNKTKANETSDMLKALGANKDNLFHKANTAESEDVVLAIKMINVFVLELSKGFGPYVERTSDLLTSLLLRSNNVDLKAISARGLPGLIKVVKETSDPNKQDIIRNLCNKYIEVLWTVIDREKDPETRLVYAMIMSKVLKVSGKVMTEAEVNALGENVFASLKKSDEAKISNQELIEDDEYGVDENEVEAIENENAEEEEYHCALAEVIGSLFEWHPEFALPIAHTIYTKALPNLFVEDMPPKMYKFGLFLVDNLIEHIGYDYLSNEWSMLSQAVIQYVTHSKAEVRHLAAYGIGQLAAKTKGDFQSLAEACMKALLTALDIRKEKDEDAEVYSLTKDNIIAAIGKIIKHQPQAINFKEVTQGWFKMLPLKSDKKEAREQHDLLMNIILNIDPVIIFGQKGENLPQAVKIMAFAVNTKYSYPDFQDKMKKVIEALVGQSDTKSLLQDAFSKLDNNHKEKMKSLLG